jgi:hypothetical protein
MGLRVDGELELHLRSFTDRFTVDLLHVLDDKVGSAVLNLRTLVARAHSDDCGSGGDTGADTRWRILEDDALLRVKAEALGSEEEGIRGGLAGLEPLVVGGDGDWWWGDADSSHAAIS